MQSGVGAEAEKDRERLAAVPRRHHLLECPQLQGIGLLVQPTLCCFFVPVFHLCSSDPFRSLCCCQVKALHKHEGEVGGILDDANAKLSELCDDADAMFEYIATRKDWVGTAEGDVRDAKRRISNAKPKASKNSSGSPEDPQDDYSQ